MNQSAVTEKSKWLSHSPKVSREKLFIVTTVFLLTGLALTFLADEGDKKWETELLQENVSERFVQVTASDDIEIFYLESREGVVKSTSKSQGVFEDLLSSGWTTETVDEEEGSGSFLSAKEFEDSTVLAHQDGNVGESAVYFTERDNDEEWSTETVDSIETNGPNVGLYTSLTFLNSNPLIFYHAAQGDRFLKAEKTNDQWNIEELEQDIGWFADTATCGEEAFVVVREKGEDNIYLGSYDGEWSMEDLNVETDTDVDVAADGCKPAIAYMDTESWEITFKQDGETKSFSESRFSRLALEIQEDYHLLYNVRNEGLFYAESEEGEEWEKQAISEDPEAGSYNDLAIDEEGDVHIVYLKEDDLFYSTEVYENRANVIYAQLLILTLFLFSFLLLVHRSKLKSSNKNID